MAVPKRRHSKSRTGKRRSTWTLRATNTARCSQCQEPKLPHRACPSCGSYRGRQVIVDNQDKE